jgi:hypothetical protein
MEGPVEHARVVPVAMYGASMASALRSRSRNFVKVLQRTHGMGVRPAEYSWTKLSTTSCPNALSRLST